ncbi:MAG: ferrochelatase [Candidatus Tokpelaia sp. JSC188]|nr:MAG: ferrochelatase [Candidatus Tokpelaia sp. JSC188]
MKELSRNRVGVLLVNLGTPNGTCYRNIRRYLAEFLSDRRIIEWPRFIWYPILHGIILNIRPKKLGVAYTRIWNDDQNESPLRTYTRSQAEKLRSFFKDDKIDIDWAMRYSDPSIATTTNAMITRGCKRIVIFPLYPQYSATTTATVNDVFFKVLQKKRFMPAIRTIPSYPDDTVYIDALVTSIKKHISLINFEPEIIITSYHGIPKSYVKRGDPYFLECERTTKALRHKLGLDEKRLLMTFQSRFGPGEWLRPYTEKIIEELARNGIKSIVVLNPGFVSDCLETLDEICNEAAHIFRKNGGKNFAHIPCLNDSEEGVHVIEHFVRHELSNWV